MVQNTAQLLTNNKRSLEFFLSERKSALHFIIRERTFAELRDRDVLGRITRNVNESFSRGAFVDLGLIDSDAKQLCYYGPYDLQGREYGEQEWFHRVIQSGEYTSDVFLGHRQSPHFAVATRHEGDRDDYYILRATFDAEMLSGQIHTAGLGPQDDIFLINRQGLLQTPSRRYGNVTERIPLPVPIGSPAVEAFPYEDEEGRQVLLGYAGIVDSPFVLMLIKPLRHGTREWFPVIRLFGFLALSIVLILAVVLWGAGQFVKNLRAESLRRAAIMHKVEYTNKLASIGRLAAGVAHEINNPLSIVNEKTGLLKDLVQSQQDIPRRDKFLGLADSILTSVERCKTITHRLLGFAKQMDVRYEEIDLLELFNEVVGFLAKEAEYRSLRIEVESEDDLPLVESDRGQLQQVFLNLLNNAVSAVKDGGHIKVSLAMGDKDSVSITVADDGIGIPESHLKRIFEPFFTTKEGAGTGLGLSITYGIVQKLGGEISVESEMGKGTRFTVILPIAREE
jgi:signal transduction histidine kinase